MTPGLGQAHLLQWPTVTAIQRVKAGGLYQAAIAASNNEVRTRTPQLECSKAVQTSAMDRKG